MLKKCLKCGGLFETWDLRRKYCDYDSKHANYLSRYIKRMGASSYDQFIDKMVQKQRKRG